MAQPHRALAAAEHGSGRIDELSALRTATGRGDHQAFARLYDLVAARVFGLILRDCAQAQEIVQEVMLEVWRTATRFDTAHAPAISWIMMIAHRRAVDRVRAEHAATRRTVTAGVASMAIPHDAVADEVADRLEYQHVRPCLGRLTDLQHQAINLAYYQGHTYREVADQLGVALPTVKTRMRDALIRLRDCLTAN